jgi:type 1 glutamine amidotransferase
LTLSTPIGSLTAFTIDPDTSGLRRTQHRMNHVLFTSLATVSLALTTGAAPMKALIIDGQNNHDWAGTTPVLRAHLEQTGLFEVEVATTPPAGGDMSRFKPDFSRYKVIVSNYNGERWSNATEDAFVKFVKNGGGFVPVHAANNSFSDWPEYNAIIGLGGWGGRTEKSGPYVYWEAKAAKVVRDVSPGRGGSHGRQHEFVVEIREPDHPVTAGLPKRWRHAEDELYDRLRGPAENLTVLATAYSDPATGGTGRHEPMLMALTYGQGRIFHTVLGHARPGDHVAMHCVGFIATFQRGTEWAATGKVTQKVPNDFPATDKVSVRQ